MRLTHYTDYSLRALIFLALKNEDELSTIKEIADTYNLSKNHLMKIIHELGQLGYIDTIRGRNGGIRLAIEPQNINIGELVLKTEEDFQLVDCFDGNNLSCVLTPACQLKGVLHEAFVAFIKVLKGYTLADLIKNKGEIESLFALKG